MWYQSTVPWNSFVPDLVTMLIAAPDMLPYSAGAPIPSTCTSSMIAGFVHQNARPVSEDVVSRPSMRQEFEATLEPKAVSEVLPSEAWLMPGDTATRSQKFRSVGRSSMKSAVKLVLTLELVTSRIGDAVTVTSSSTASRPSAISRLTVAAMLTRTPSTRWSWKPSSAAVTT